MERRTALGIDEGMTRIVSLLLLLVVALGAGAGLAWAGEMQEVRVETNGMELPPTQDAEDVEVGDEVVVAASSSSVLGTPRPVRATDPRPESIQDMPQTRPPRG